MSDVRRGRDCVQTREPGVTTDPVSSFWREFCATDPSVNNSTPYQVWHFGNTAEMASDLAGLVLAGNKTATASSLKMNELYPRNAPHPDGYSVVTDFEGDPLCIIQTTEIRHLPFKDVDALFAHDEGEGDLSLEHWRRVHWDYFRKEAAQFGFEFDEESVVCCERFKLLYPR